MNIIHIHLITVHIPVLFVPLGTILLGLGLTRENPTLRQTGYSLMIIGAFFGSIAYLSGEEIESSIRAIIPGSRSPIHAHEEAAEVAFTLSYIGAFLATCSIGSRYIKYHKLEFILGIITLIIGLVSTTTLGYAAYKGGQIRHTEIHATSYAQD